MCAQPLQSCLTLCDLIDCSWLGSSVLGILQARILEWAGGSDSKESAYKLETWAQSLSQEDPLKEEMATHSNILPGASYEERGLVGYSLCGHKELDMTKQLDFHFLSVFLLQGISVIMIFLPFLAWSVGLDYTMSPSLLFHLVPFLYL